MKENTEEWIIVSCEEFIDQFHTNPIRIQLRSVSWIRMSFIFYVLNDHKKIVWIKAWKNHKNHWKHTKKEKLSIPIRHKIHFWFTELINKSIIESIVSQYLTFFTSLTWTTEKSKNQIQSQKTLFSPEKKF